MKPKLAKPKIIIYHMEGKNVHAILVATSTLTSLALLHAYKEIKRCLLTHADGKDPSQIFLNKKLGKKT